MGSKVGKFFKRLLHKKERVDGWKILTKEEVEAGRPKDAIDYVL